MRRVRTGFCPEPGVSIDPRDYEHEDNPEKIAAEHEKRIRRCSSCNAMIIFFDTLAGKRMPVNADTVEVGDMVIDLSRHKSHFATCPKADKHRRPR